LEHEDRQPRGGAQRGVVGRAPRALREGGDQLLVLPREPVEQAGVEARTADAFLVRMTIVPAVMAIVGARMWWLPRWLDRLLPDLDIEGESLDRRLAAARQE
jgi:hypothetical protein